MAAVAPGRLTGGPTRYARPSVRVGDRFWSLFRERAPCGIGENSAAEPIRPTETVAVSSPPVWRFRRMQPGEMNIDPIEGEFFCRARDARVRFERALRGNER